MATLVTVRPLSARAPEEEPGPRPRAASPRVILALALLGVADALYLCYVHLFLSSACTGGGSCRGVLESAYGRVLGVPLAAYGAGLFAALALAAARRSLGWVRLLAVAGSLPGPFLVYVQAARLHEWCPFCLVATALVFAAALLSLRGGGRACVEVARAPLYLAALALPPLLAAGIERGLVERDARRALAGGATVAGETYMLAEIDRAPEVARLEWEKHRARLAWVERKVLEREAAEQGLEVDELVGRNVDMKVVIPEAEIGSRYREEGGAEGTVPREERLRIAALLAAERRPRVEEEYLKGLFAKWKVSVALPPPAVREAVEFTGPSRGPRDAPLEIVLFSDFSCPLCARVHWWLREQGESVRVAFRHLPLGPPGPAAFAAAAAHEQDRFWEMADVLFRRRATFDASRIRDYAREAGLDLAAFDRSLASGRPQAAVAADAEAARALGVRTAPTLFVNGVHFVGIPDARLLRALGGP